MSDSPSQESPKGYTDKTAVGNYLLLQIDDAFNSQINDWILAVEQEIEQITGRIFIADDVPSERYYDGCGTRRTFIDDAVEITKVEVGSKLSEYTEVLSDYFESYPLNAIKQKRPITRIKLFAGIFPRYPAAVRVTARWGFADRVPKDIKFAATVMLAGIINAAQPTHGNVQQETIGRYSVTYKTLDQKSDYTKAMEILENYRKEDF